MGRLNDDIDRRRRGHFFGADDQVKKSQIIPFPVKSESKKSGLIVITFSDEPFGKVPADIFLFHHVPHPCRPGGINQHVQCATEVPQQKLSPVADDDAFAFFGNFVDDGFHEIQEDIRLVADETVEKSGRLLIKVLQIFKLFAHGLNRALQPGIIV